MPIHPSGINRVNFLSHAAQDSGIAHSINLRGGFQEVYSIAERNAIPLMENNTAGVYDGFTQSDDVLSSGKRRVGMFVHVLEERKIYTLIPVGYFGNGGELGETEWAALPEWHRALLIDPTGTYSNGPAGPPLFIAPTSSAADIGIAADANSCWVEVEFGGGVYNSNLDPAITMVEDVGGMQSGTTVADLSGVQTYDQLFDTILFPTSYPQASNPYVTLSFPSNSGITNGLKVIGSDFSATLITTANRGQISLDGSVQGPYAGDITAANVVGPGGTTTLGVTAPTGIDDFPVSGHIVTLGSNLWTLNGTFAQGPEPLDSTGQPYNSIRYNGGSDDNNASFEGVYPIFLGADTGENDFVERALISFGQNNVQCLQDYAEDSGATGNPVLNHRILVPVARSTGAITIQVFNPNGSGAAAWPDNTAAWTESGSYVQRTIEGNSVDYRLFTKDGSSGGSNNYRLVF